jgi:hypothetical protein
MPVTWTCPECGRWFGRRNQSHECTPALTLDEYFAARPAYERDIFQAVLAHLEEVGEVRFEAVQVGILFKRSRTFAELRPRRDRVVLSVLLSRRMAHPRIAKTWHGSGQRSAYFVDLRDRSDVDEDVRDWLTEAYASSPL